jgi:hypothetical protein
MKSRRYLYCIFGVMMAGLTLFLLLTFLPPKAAEAKDRLPAQPVTIAQAPDQRLVVFPDPPQAHEPTEIRVFFFNDDSVPVTRYAQFYVGQFGVAQMHSPISERIPFDIQPQSDGTAVITWVPPDMGPYCFYVEIFDALNAPNPIAAYQHNVVYQAHPNPDGGQFVETFLYSLRNPLDVQANMVLSVTSPIEPIGWQVSLIPQHIELGHGEVITASVVFTYTGGVPLPPDGIRLFEIHATANGMPVPGFQKVFGPPLRLHQHPEPGFAESEISVNPYPVLPGEPAEICVEVRNVTQQPRHGFVYFRVAPFGIGQIFEPISPPIDIFIPELGLQRPCIHWVAQNGGQYAFEVSIETPDYPMPVSSQRVIDVGELLLPGTTSVLYFPVRNPFPEAVTIMLGMIPMQQWEFMLSQDVLQDMKIGETRLLSMTVTVPPDTIMPPDGSPVIDLEAYVGDNLFGGFRKIYRPPVPIHQPGDPIYAEREITISPYPPREREPTEICVDLRNPTEMTQTMTVVFSVSGFGIGLPFHDIARPIAITMPAQSIKKVCVTWVPPFGGRFGAQVGIQAGEHEMVYSQRLIDVGEILLPNQWSAPFEFPLENPYPFTITVSLGAIRYLPQWVVTFDTPTLVLLPFATQTVVMHVLPVQRPGDPEPQEGQPVIDVEAYWDYNGQNGLLGGFRKLFFPPVPIHQPQDPPYAEREINIFPYPPQAGEPTRLEFVARNPTDRTQPITVTFEWGNLGIGLPFTPIDGPLSITLPPLQAGVVGINWVPPFGGEFCVRVRVEAPFFTEPFYSARNISIVRLPEPYGPPEVFQFEVGHVSDIAQPLTVTLGVRPYLSNWQISLKPARIIFEPGQLYATVVMTITPPANPADLPIDGGPIVDVSGYVNGNLIGGIRKVWRPPVPLGQLGEPSYAESEIVISPDPPRVDHPATFSAQVRNNSDYPQTIDLQFGWADLGVGILFTTTNVVPTQTVITLSPHMTTTVSAQWTPPYSGHFCVQIELMNEQTGEALHSQRNVDVIEVPGNQCEPFIQEFLLQNSTPIVITVTLGSNAINLPLGWTYSVDPDEVVLGPFESITVTVTITPPCNLLANGLMSPLAGLDMNNPTKIQVEGYNQNGELVGGVELQLLAAPHRVYMPLVARTSSLGESLAPPEETRSIPWSPYWLMAILFMGGIGFYYRYFHL